MTTIIKCQGFANGSCCPVKGQYVETFDHNAYNGLGYGTFTTDPTKAMKFQELSEAMDFWNKVSTAHPMRGDGRPNKPMTAMHALFEKLPIDNSDTIQDAYSQ